MASAVNLRLTSSCQEVKSTLAGMEINDEWTCAEVAGRRTVWEVVARGSHERFVVNLERFARKVAAKGAS